MSARKPSAAGPQLTPEQMDLVERYVAAYNAVDKELRRRMRTKDEADFSAVVRAYADKHPAWTGDAQRLLALGRLRNLLVHEHTKPRKYWEERT